MQCPYNQPGQEDYKLSQQLNDDAIDLETPQALRDMVGKDAATVRLEVIDSYL